MSNVGAFEAKNKFAELLDRVERGEEIVITRRGRPAARLVPADARDDERAATALKRLDALRSRLRKEGVTFTTEELLSLRDEGRR